MRLLLDTHVLLWWLGDAPRLGPRAASAIGAAEGVVYVSAASGWEIAVKRALGRLEAPEDLRGVVEATDLHELPISLAHAAEAGGLPDHHRDPFDRMLVAQARIEGLTLVTSDERIGAYDVHVLAAGA